MINENNGFQKKLVRQNTIYEYSPPPVIDASYATDYGFSILSNSHNSLVSLLWLA